MVGDTPPQLGRLVAPPLVTIGVIAAVIVWEIEHVGSLFLAVVLTASATLVGVFMALRVRKKIRNLSEHYERLLRIAEEQSQRAEAANRVKDEFLATLSHELRTPLNSMLGWSRLLASGKLDENQRARAVQAIERAGWAQWRLVEDLLDVSQILSGKLEISPRPALIQPIVDAAVHLLKPAADGKQIAVESNVDPSIGPVMVDPDRLQQIVWNLLSNAIKFTPSHGRVFVQVQPDEDTVRLLVRDTGIGFDQETALGLFDLFRQGDNSPTRQYGGLGLGLNIVRHLVELHGGTVTARSAGEHQGSQFAVLLPMRRVDTFDSEIPPAAGLSPVLHGVSVLVVDDDPMALDFARSSLEQFGAVVRAASSASEARDRFLNEPPDVLVSDLRMSDEDGLQLIRQIRLLESPKGRHTPALALTALARSDDKRSALQAGYEMHVSKPVDPFELAAAVARLARSSA